MSEFSADTSTDLANSKALAGLKVWETQFKKMCGIYQPKPPPVEAHPKAAVTLTIPEACEKLKKVLEEAPNGKPTMNSIQNIDEVFTAIHEHLEFCVGTLRITAEEGLKDPVQIACDTFSATDAFLHRLIDECTGQDAEEFYWKLLSGTEVNESLDKLVTDLYGVNTKKLVDIAAAQIKAGAEKIQRTSG